MKLTQLIENKVETETGWANLLPDGSMVVDNSGYKQRLSAEQVQAAWSGAKRLPLTADVVADMKADGLSDEEMIQYAPYWDGDYWDFGDELHIIPARSEFAPPFQP